MSRYLIILIILEVFIFANSDRVNAYIYEMRKGEELAKRFEMAFRNNSKELMEKLILKIQSNPAAVKAINKRGLDVKKAFINRVNTLHKNTENIFKKKFVDKYNELHPKNRISVDDIKFKEFTNPSKNLKVGHDWDVTVTVNGKEVNYKEVKDILHDSFYEAAGGKKRYPNMSSNEFAHKHKLEVTSSHHPEAYEGGSEYLKDTAKYKVKDPERLSKTIEYKSDIEMKNIDKLSIGQKEIAKGERARQFTKQFEKHIKPIVQKYKGKIPQNVEKGVEILNKIGKYDKTLKRVFTPADADKALSKIGKYGESVESIIKKGSSLAEAAQKLNSKNLVKGKVRKVNSIVGEAAIGIGILNVSGSIVDVIKGRKSAGELGEEVADIATGGAVSTLKSTYKKNRDFRDTVNLRNQAQEAEDDYIIQQNIKQLVENGTPLDRARKIMFDLRYGDKSSYIKELHRLRNLDKNVGFISNNYIKLQEADDNVTYRAKKVAKDALLGAGQGVVRSVKYILEAGVDTTKILTTKYEIDKAKSDAKKRKDETSTLIKNKLKDEGLSDEATNRVIDAFKEGDNKLLKKVTKSLRKDKEIARALDKELNTYEKFALSFQNSKRATKAQKELASSILSDIDSIRVILNLAKEIMTTTTNRRERDVAWSRVINAIQPLRDKITRLTASNVRKKVYYKTNCSILRYNLNLPYNYSCCKDEREYEQAKARCKNVEKRLLEKFSRVKRKMALWIKQQEGDMLQNNRDYDNYPTPWGTFNGLKKCFNKVAIEYCNKLGVNLKYTKKKKSQKRKISSKAKKCYESYAKIIANARKSNASQNPASSIGVVTPNATKQCAQKLKECQDKMWKATDNCRAARRPMSECNLIHNKLAIKCAQENVDCSERAWKSKCGIK